MEKKVFDIEKIKKIAHEHIGMILGIFAVIAVFIAICVGIYSATPTAGREYWYEDNGHFPWVGVSAFLAGIGLILNSIQNRRKFKADLVSKSRIEFMKEARENISTFYALQYSRYKDTLNVEIERLYAELAPNYEIRKEHLINYFEKVDENNDNITKVQIEKTHLKLLFPKSDKNEKILSCLENVSQKAENLKKVIEQATQSNIEKKNIFITALDISEEQEVVNAYKEFEEAATKFIDVSSEYIQREWETAKLGN